jgi:ATP-dependent helicase HrpB
MSSDPIFPITEVLPRIREALHNHTRLVLEAPPGAGKTTQIPLALLGEAWCKGKKIIMLEPRRVAARAAATFMSGQLEQEVGNTVGYRIRFENRICANTRVEVVTEGILTRMMQDDPLLEGVGAILFDEFHERHLSGDLGLALALDIQQQIRPDLRLVLMSATLDGEKLAAYMDAGRISSAGRAYPVETSHFTANRNEDLAAHSRRAIVHAFASHPGDILVFLPGQREISQVSRMVSDLDAEIVQLYGDMPVEMQSAALAAHHAGRRRIVLATNIAESSVTLPCVRVVIDSGLAREPRFDPNTGFPRLDTVYISRASADQRSGRAGRVAAGWCYRLWDATRRLDISRNPEINTTDLAPLALELAAWGNETLRFPDPPPEGTLAASRELLVRLQALDSNLAITATGKRMLSLGTHPRLAAMLLETKGQEELALACDLVALLENRDLQPGNNDDSIYSRWLVLAGREKSAALQRLRQGAAQWRKRTSCNHRAPGTCSARELGDVLVHAFPDRIAHQHPDNLLRYQLSNGRTARLQDNSQLRGEPWIVISELRHEKGDSLVLRAAPVDEARLHDDFPERFSDSHRTYWDEATRALVCRQESCFDRIVLDSRPAGKPDAAEAARALCDAVASYGLESLPWTDRLRQWRLRVNLLRNRQIDPALPDLSDQALLESRHHWLLPALTGLYRLDSLDATALEQAIMDLVDWQTRSRIDAMAPTHIRVPSGLERPVIYNETGDPVLAVKLQELFGLAETPAIANGRIPLLLHLLSPGGKPLQVTQDLRSFWANTYPEVKKEMKGRYPKHPWPDDPWTAEATHRAKPRVR